MAVVDANPCVCVCVCVCLCVCALWVGACVHVRVCVHICACIYACGHTDLLVKDSTTTEGNRALTKYSNGLLDHLVFCRFVHTGVRQQVQGCAARTYIDARIRQRKREPRLSPTRRSDWRTETWTMSESGTRVQRGPKQQRPVANKPTNTQKTQLHDTYAQHLS